MKTTKQQGFTLIELVIVIIILGILAVTAAPKFLNLTNDARTSTVKGAEGAIKGGANIVYSKAAIEGEEATDSTDLQVGAEATDTVAIAYGYPAEASFGVPADLARWLDLSAADWTITGTNPVVITPAGYTEPDASVVAKQCRVTYTEAASAGASPTITSQTGGC
ncbi:prepilin-type N-terminal cleavage/methylation domain-containing protein [Agarivorans sp. TSD2052]|uniref:prepilin-type N-terminal cleavage/methylation domain-containing protein n=1 Tax=Agarivorans sp. TSD2052 TaxID=2937286 RepID=UPI00200EEE6C|nr:prepilin-type N-terminal cleavage/methylation domain-containing protein [Agarivorans sp. TSD2052]UPW17999.1 prepilin-type N-terminal cleavage/methylation domain-containing protein [Agarivorans sp. TSD2052]